jgi:hypothetical protein
MAKSALSSSGISSGRSGAKSYLRLRTERLLVTQDAIAKVA